MRKNVKLSIVLSCLSLALSMMYSTAAISYVNAVLLSSYPFQYLAYFYLSSALFYIFLTYFSASYFSRHLKQTLAIALFINIGILAAVWLWHGKATHLTWLPFVFCVFLLANGKFLIQIYWNITARVLQIREFKNSSNFLSVAIAIGGILMGLMGPVIVKNYGVIGLLPAIGIFLLINLGLLPYNIPKESNNAPELTTETVSQHSHRQYNLSRLLIYFSIITLIFSTLADYIFKYQIGMSFGETEIAIYTSRLAAVAYSLTILIELFYVKKILQRFGLLTFILQAPIAIIIIIVAAVFKKDLFTASLLWIVYTILNLSILDVSFQLLGNALPEQYRGVSKLRAKGIGLFFGSLICSVIIFLFSNVMASSAMYVFFIGAAIFFIILTQRIVKAYNQSLERNLKEHHILNMEALSFTDNETQWNETIQSCFDSKDAEVKLMGYELLGKRQTISNEILDRVNADLYDTHLSVRVEAAKLLSTHMNEKYFIELSKRLEVETEAEVIWWIFQGFLSGRKEDALNIAQQYLNSKVELIQAGRISILIKFGNIMDVIMALNRLARMIHSPDPMIRMTATRILSLFDLQGAVDSLSNLMIDSDIHVSMMAIQAALEHPRKEYIPSLIHQMGVKNVTYYAYKAILHFGADIIPSLVSQMNNIKNPVFHRTAIRCIASIDGELAEKALAQLLEHKNTLICNDTAKAIAYRALSMEFTQEFLQALKKKLRDEESRITYYKQLLKLELTPFEKQEITALMYSAVYRVLYLFSIAAPQTLMPIVSLILAAMVQSDFSNFFQEKIELLDSYLHDSHDRMFLSQLFNESKITVVDRSILLAADKLDPWLVTVFSIQSLTHEDGPMHDLEKLVILRGCDLFKNLPADLLLLLAERLEVLLMPKDTVLFKEGDFSGDLYIVAEGDIHITHEKQLISHKRKFDFIGELSILDDKPRTATAVTATDVVVLKMNKVEYDRILDDFPDILRTIAQTLLGYLRQYQS